jgi:hypothetical protein
VFAAPATLRGLDMSERDPGRDEGDGDTARDRIDVDHGRRLQRRAIDRFRRKVSGRAA